MMKTMMSARSLPSRWKPRSTCFIKVTATLCVAGLLILAYISSQQNIYMTVPVSSLDAINQSSVQIRNTSRYNLKTSFVRSKIVESTLPNDFTRYEIIRCGDTIDRLSIVSSNVTLISKSNVPCPKRPQSLAGRFVPTTTVSTYRELADMFPDVQDGGHYTPRMCTPIEKTAIIIPYRNRCRHLYTLLPNLIPMLMRQNVDFTIFIVEQSTPGTFNRGILFNAGYLEALKVDNYDCFILHDVDMIAIDDRNMYRCNTTGPIHFSPGVNKFNYKLRYSILFGGVVGFTREQFKVINGASNLYFGWGGEDDDLRNRAVNMKLPLLRKSLKHGVYDMVNHTGVMDEGWVKNPDRIRLYSTGRERQHLDGISSLVYNVTWYRRSPLYTWIGVGFNKTAITNIIPENLRIGSKNDYNYLTGKFTIIS